MTEEEKKAINNLWSSATDVMFNVLYSQEELQEDLKIALNLIKNQQSEKEQLKAELEKRDKVIDLMAKAWKQDDSRTVEEIKQYFEKQVESEDRQ